MHSATALDTSQPVRPKSPQDAVIGTNIRRIRLAKGMSQEKLGNALGLTFQQVQKYEKGTNRVGGSRMAQICGALGCGVNDLFRGTEQGGSTLDPSLDPYALLGASQIGLRMAVAFTKLPPPLQAAFVKFVEKMVEEL